MASSILYVVAFFDALEQEACDQKLSSKFLVCLVSSKSLGNNQDYNNLAIQHRRVRKGGGVHYTSLFPSCHSGLLSGDFPDTRTEFYSRRASGLKIDLECNG